MGVERKAALFCAGMVFTAIILGTLIYFNWLRSEPAFTGVKDLTLIIDPGHGGEDGGAVSVTGAYESEINLAISLKLRDMMNFFGINTVMTRDSESIDYPDSADTIKAKKTADQKNRLELINSTPNSVLISIHQNQYTGPSPFGAQALYAPTDGSREFAETLQDNLISALNPENYRTAAQIQGSIYIMNNIRCPGVLVECGFLSNPTEEPLLRTKEYQLKTAAVIGASYLSSRDIFKEIYLGDTDES